MNSPMKSPMREFVINTGPVIALVAATGSLEHVSQMLPLLACGAGIYLGLHFNVLILLPISLLGFGAVLFASWSGYGPYDCLGLLFLFFVSAQAGYVIGLTGRDAYGQVLARLGSTQSKGL